MKGMKKLIAHKRFLTIICFLFLTVFIFSIFYFTTLTGWTISGADYKLVLRTNGSVNNLTLTLWISSFNVSGARLSVPPGIRKTPADFQNENLSRIQIIFENFNGSSAVVSLSDIPMLPNIPESFTQFESSFETYRPQVEGDLVSFSNVFVHFSISADTPLGRTAVYSYTYEAASSKGKVEWLPRDLTQSKDRQLTVSYWGFVLLSATISSLCITLFSLATQKKIFQIFPTVTLASASIMCLTYLYVGVGDDLLSIGNGETGFRVLLSVLSPFFHFDYFHLMNNLLFSFLLGGCLLEIWLPKYCNFKRYALYLSPLLLSIPASFLSVLSDRYLYVSTGASFWCIGIALVLVIVINSERSNLVKRFSDWDLLALFLTGYLIVLSTWNYAASFLIDFSSPSTRSVFLSHILFALSYSLIPLLVVSRWKSLSVNSRKE